MSRSSIWDPGFSARAKEKSGGFIVAGSNYGQGSSREHAALVPLYLKIKGVIAKSFARIHRDNLINNGILPLEFIDGKDYERISEGDNLVIDNACYQIASRCGKVTVKNVTKGYEFETALPLTERQMAFLLDGGVLNNIAKRR